MSEAQPPPPPKGHSDRHARTRRYFGERALETLAVSRVLVVGAGAVGNEIVKHLGMVGLGAIALVDPDVVVESNLNRCVLFRPEHARAKTPKPAAIAETAGQLGWPTRVETYARPIEEVPHEAWREIDLTICGVDDDHARHYLNMHLLGFAHETGYSRFLIEGAMGADFTQMRTCELPGTACLVCNWTPEYLAGVMERRRQQTCLEFFVEARAAFPSISTQTSWVAAQMASEAIKLLVGLPTYRSTGTWPAGDDNRLRPHLGVVLRSETPQHDVQRATAMRNPRCVEPFCREPLSTH